MKPTSTRNNQNKTKHLILGVFLFFYLYQLVDHLPSDILHGINMWVYTDWLIDYSSGFVRRGLAGELIDFLSAFLNPRVSVSVIVWMIFSLIVFGYLRLIAKSIRQLNSFLIIAILFLPSLLPFYLYDHGAFGRKEILGFLLLLFHLYGLESLNLNLPKKNPLLDYYWWLLPISLLLLPGLILVHEGAFLLFTPLHIIISYSFMRSQIKADFKRILFYLLVLYSPVLFTFLFVVMSGQASFGTALAICNKWELLGALEYDSCQIPSDEMAWTLPGSFASLFWPISQAFSLTFSYPIKTYFAWAVILILLSISSVKTGLTTSSSILAMSLPYPNQQFINKHKRNSFYKYFLIPFLTSIPMYIFGLDWGRWFAVTCTSFIMVSLSGEINQIEGKLIGQFEPESIVPAQSALQSRDSKSRNLVEILILLSIVLFIRLPHCCITRGNMFAGLLRSLVEKIFNLF
jgi:hypothetical protein